MDTIIHLASTTSTNDEMQKLLNANTPDLQEGTLIYADEQTKGRGQVGNSWESETGKNLTGTIVLFPDFLKADEQFLITQMGALAVVDFLTKYAHLTNVTVKWPNDVYWNDKKISGTLNEAMLMGKSIDYVMLGVGINLNQSTFRSDAPNPVSVVQITGQEFNQTKAAVLFRQCVMERYMQLANGDGSDIRRDYMACLYRKDGFYAYADERGERFEAEIVTIHPAGEFELRLRSGEHRTYLFKQVHYIL